MRCAGCSFVFDHRLPTERELEEHYSVYSYGSRKPCPPATRDSYNTLLEAFESYRSLGRILDVGCGQGDFLLEARKRGWDAFGTEYSQSAATLCRAEGLKVVTGPLIPSSFGSLQFDVVTSFEVFEHINTGPAELSAIASLMRPGGLLYLTTPNFNALLRHLEGKDFKMIVWPEHISFYAPASFRALARGAGLKVKRIETTGLAPGRLKAALRSSMSGASQTSDPDQQSWREDSAVLRDRIRTSRGLQFIKWVVDATLNTLGLGDTLKVWLEKPVRPEPGPNAEHDG